MHFFDKNKKYHFKRCFDYLKIQLQILIEQSDDPLIKTPFLVNAKAFTLFL